MTPNGRECGAICSNARLNRTVVHHLAALKHSPMQKLCCILYLQTSCPLSQQIKSTRNGSRVWSCSRVDHSCSIPEICYRNYCPQPSSVSILFKCFRGKYLISGEEANVSLACLHVTGSHTSYLRSLSSFPGATEVIWEAGSRGEGRSPHHKLPPNWATKAKSSHFTLEENLKMQKPQNSEIWTVGVVASPLGTDFPG